MSTILFVSSSYSTSDFSSVSGLGRVLGRSNYSYTIAMQSFASALSGAGHEVHELAIPVIVRKSTIDAMRVNRNVIHLAFYPPEELKLLKGARNILCFAWEFSLMKTPSMRISTHAFADTAQMLDVVDEIWTPSRYAHQAIARMTSRPVFVVPAPVRVNQRVVARRLEPRLKRQITSIRGIGDIICVPLFVFPRYQDRASLHALKRARPLSTHLKTLMREWRSVVIYLCVINPHDARKGLLETIEAFTRFAKHNKNALLLIKTSSHDNDLSNINTRIFTHQIAKEDELAGQYSSENIIICNDSLSFQQLSYLYEVADFYICTSHAEGQNLPLLEAMGHGVVPVSVSHTAMADYISSENAVEIPSKSEPLPPWIAQKYGLYGAEWFTTSVFDVYSALDYSYRMPSSEYIRLSMNAATTVGNFCSPSVIVRQIRKRFEAIRND